MATERNIYLSLFMTAETNKLWRFEY